MTEESMHARPNPNKSHACLFRSEHGESGSQDAPTGVFSVRREGLVASPYVVTSLGEDKVKNGFFFPTLGPRHSLPWTAQGISMACSRLGGA